MRVGGDGEDEEDEQVRPHRRVHVRTRLHPPAAALSTSHATSYCDLHESGLAHKLVYHGGYHLDLWTTSLLRITSAHPPAPSHCHAWTSLPFTSARSSPRLAVFDCQSSATIRRGPAAAAAAATPPLLTSPNTTTAPPTSTHQPHQHLAPSLLPVYTRPAPGFEPREVA